MRLIDADELKKDIMSYKTMPEIRKAICEVIDDAPTVELDESVIQEVLNKRCMTAVANEFLIALQLKTLRGRWDEIREPFGWDDILSARCSVCGESYPYPEDTGFNDIVEMFKYCPNCGSKMEAGNRWKEEDDEE